MAYNHARQYSGLHPPALDRQPLLSNKTDGNLDSTLVNPNPMANLLVAQGKASRKRVVKKTGFLAAGIVVCTIGMISAFLSYICIFHQCQVSESSVISTAPLGPVLTISQVTSHVAPLSVPFIMGILSNLASARWLRAGVDGGPNRPSPMQLGLLMSMYDGAGLSSLFSSIQYTFKGPKSGHKIVQPPLFRQCLVFLGSLLAITYLTVAADLWLHASSTNVVVLYNSTYRSRTPANFGRELNTTPCLAEGACDNGGFSEGSRVSLNISSLHSVVFSDDQTALIVPEHLPENIRYSAQTFGVKSQCKSVTRECLFPLVASDGSSGYGSLDWLNLNCSQGGIRFADGVMDSIGLNLLRNDQDGSTIEPEGKIDTNPFNTGDIMYTRTFLDPGVNNTDQFINNTGWFAHGMYGAYNVVYCNVTVLSVTYIYESSRFITVSYSLQPLDIAGRMMSSGSQVAGFTSISSAAVSQTGIQSLSAFEDIYSLELSRQLLAGGAYLYEPGPVLEIQHRENVNGSKLQLVPLIFFVATLLIFLCQVLYIGTRTIVATWGVQYVGLAARHLSSPIIAIQKLYGHPSPELTWETDSDKGFGAETESDRLHAGPVLLPDNDIPGSVFLVGKGDAHQHGGPYPPVPDHQPLLSSNTNGNPDGISDVFHTSVGTTSNLQQAQEKASQNRAWRNTGLIAAGICVCTIGMIFTLLSYICIFHKCQASKSSVISTASLGPVLTISQAASQFAPLTVPFVMGVLSNLASVRWLQSSIDGGPNRPSPMQLGLLMSMYNGAGLSSLFSSVQYIFNGPKSGQKIFQPLIFRQCVLFLGSLLATTYLAAAADSWLHASSTNVVVLSYSPYISGGPTDFGRDINSTICAQVQGSDLVASMTCGLYLYDDNLGKTDDGSRTQAQLSEGSRVVSNTSTSHRVVLSDDQTALVVPQNLPGNISYSAQTLGVKSQCISVTRSCIFPAASSNSSAPYGPDDSLAFNCSSIGFDAKVNGLYGLMALGSQGAAIAAINPGYPIDTNPFSTGDLVTTMAYLERGDNQDQFINNTGWFVHGTHGAYNIVYCNVTALSVTYSYESSRYITKSYTPQPLAIARYMMSGGSQVAGGYAVSLAAISHTGIQSISAFESTYFWELSRQLVAGSAYIYESRPVSQIQSENNVDASKLQLIPLVLFVSTLLIFLCQVLYIATRTMVSTWGVQYVGLAARHLSSPIIAIQRLYGHPNPELTWEMDSDKGFGPETESDRLFAGPVALSDGDIPGSVFMVAKGRDSTYNSFVTHQ